MPQDPKTLLASANCYECFAPNVYTVQLMKLAVLVQILKNVNPNAVTDPQSLLAQSACVQCFSPNTYALTLIENALLDSISTGGVGTGQIVAYSGASPNSDHVVPANKNAPAIAVKPGASTWTWSIANQDWE